MKNSPIVDAIFATEKLEKAYHRAWKALYPH